MVWLDKQRARAKFSDVEKAAKAAGSCFRQHRMPSEEGSRLEFILA
jgi:hypothetical protein